MPFAIPTYEELKAIAEEALRTKAGITNFSDSSVMGTFVNVNAAFVADIYNFIAQIEAQSNLSTASGPYLDRLGELFGVKRLPAKEATTVGEGSAVVFINESEVEDISVPAHTRIWSPKDYNIAYFTTHDIVVPNKTNASNKAYVDVEAAGTGIEFNVGPETLTQHNIPNSSLRVVNILPISNGMSVEVDDNYRYRISQALLAKSGSNETAIRLRLLEIPGIKDAVLQPLVRGTGTVDAIIIPVARRATKELIDSAQAAINEVVAFGISAKCKPPVDRAVELSINVRVAPAGDQALIKSLVSSAARSYIDNLPIGDQEGRGDLIYNELLSRVMGVHQHVIDVLIKLKIDGKPALNINHKAKPGERFFVQSIKVS